MTLPAVGDLATAAQADQVLDPLLDQVLLFTPGGSTTTTGAGTATWVTLGNVTVPTWASKAIVNYTMNGIFCTGTTSSTTYTLKIGSASGAVTKTILIPGVANQRFHLPTDDIVTGLSTGSQSVTISATFVANTVVTADATSYFTAWFRFQP